MVLSTWLQLLAQETSYHDSWSQDLFTYPFISGKHITEELARLVFEELRSGREKESLLSGAHGLCCNDCKQR